MWKYTQQSFRHRRKLKSIVRPCGDRCQCPTPPISTLVQIQNTFKTPFVMVCQQNRRTKPFLKATRNSPDRMRLPDAIIKAMVAFVSAFDSIEIEKGFTWIHVFGIFMHGNYVACRWLCGGMNRCDSGNGQRRIHRHVAHASQQAFR